MDIPTRMAAVLLTGHGGFDKLEYREDVPTPAAGTGEVLIEVGAAGINNTDINTRIAWYSKAVGGETSQGGASGFEEANSEDGSWTGTPLQFPRIQGADCCGRIVSVGEGVDAGRIGERVLVRAVQPGGADSSHLVWAFGSECDGGFAQYTKTRSTEAFVVESDWSDIELASLPCAYSTAEGMLHRASVGAERVLITGASGGVGSAAVQLAKRRGAEVIALAAREKADAVKALGADRVVNRGDNLIDALGRDSVDVVVDLVAGPQWPELLDILRPLGRYATAGAIAGPMVELDTRTLYLKDLTLFGCTFQEDVVFRNLVRYVEGNEIRPVVAKTYPLADVVRAQKDFIAKQFVGKLVLVPPR